VIHCFCVGTTNLVLDVNSGALHHVSDTAFTLLKSMEKACSNGRPFSCVSQNISKAAQDVSGDAQDILNTAPQDVKVEIQHLMDTGLLFSSNAAEEVNLHMKTRQPVVKALCLHIAHECNLRCVYCFAGQGNYSENDRGLMPASVGKAALDFLIEHSGTRRNLEVDFFGGEPMMNFDAVKEIVAYGRVMEVAAGKKFRFTLTTNGTFLDEENIAYINENFDNVVLSLDGRREVNDHMRPLVNGEGSYDVILPKIHALAEARNHENYYVRGTYTRLNPDFAADVAHLADVGFKNISVEPVVAPQSENFAILEEDLPALFAEYERLTYELLARENDGSGVLFFHFEMDITGGPCIAKRVTGCGAGSEYLAVTPSGKLYPCHQFVGDEKFCVGDVQNGLRENDLTRDFATCHVFTKSECSDCWAKFYCSGGCHATAYRANGSIRQPDKISCALMKKRIECALHIFAIRQGCEGSQ